MSSDIIIKKQEVYTKQINRTLDRLKRILETKDQDYINTYVLKVLESSFHRGVLPQKDIPLVANILNNIIKYDRSPKSVKERNYREWHHALDNLIHFKVDYCSICGNKLHAQGKFPKGYPEAWKLCCAHRDALIAGYDNINRGDSMHIGDFEAHKEKFEELFSLTWD